mgnify:CR=1 FL=1
MNRLFLVWAIARAEISPLVFDTSNINLNNIRIPGQPSKSIVKPNELEELVK